MRRPLGLRRVRDGRRSRCKAAGSDGRQDGSETVAKRRQTHADPAAFGPDPQAAGGCDRAGCRAGVVRVRGRVGRTGSAIGEASAVAAAAPSPRPLELAPDLRPAAPTQSLADTPTEPLTGLSLDTAETPTDSPADKRWKTPKGKRATRPRPSRRGRGAGCSRLAKPSPWAWTSPRRRSRQTARP